MLTVAIPKRNKLQNIIVLTPKDGREALRQRICKNRPARKNFPVTLKVTENGPARKNFLVTLKVTENFSSGLNRRRLYKRFDIKLKQC